MFGEIKLGFAIASVYYIKTEMDNERLPRKDRKQGINIWKQGGRIFRV